MMEHPLLAAVTDLPDHQREEVLAAFAAVEHGGGPVPEVSFLALRDATLRSRVQRLAHQVGRVLISLPGPNWTTGYRDDLATELAGSTWHRLPTMDRAVLTLILIHSIAIPRSQGKIMNDSWVSAEPTPQAEIFAFARLPKGEVTAALQRLRAAGLVSLLRSQGGYVPGPQLHRLTPKARRRLQEELILAAAPASPLAAAIRARREPQPSSDSASDQPGAV